MTARFVTLSADFRHDAVVDNSEFLAFAQRADSPGEALEQLTALRLRYPAASHHCWAYKMGAAYRFNDDGEPGGTAGAPILRAIEGQHLDHVMAVVVRFYGGVKLGTGGLVRAYGGTAAECLRRAPKLEVRPRVPYEVSVPFEYLSHLYRLLTIFDIEKGPESYTGSGVTLPLGVYAEDLAAFAEALRNATRGQGT